jgi:hypothetical protein
MNLSNYYKISLSYFFFCGLIWLLGYWSTFDINILEYINITDVLKLFIYPFTTNTIVALSIILTQGIFIASDSTGDMPKIKNKIIRFSLSALFFLIAMTLLTWGSNLQIETWLPVLIFPIASYCLFRCHYLKTLIKVEASRWVVSLLLIYIPMNTFSISKDISNNIYNNIEYNYTMKDSIVYKFLGKVGDFNIYISRDNTVKCIEPINKNKQLYLHKFPKPIVLVENIEK